MSKYKIGWMPGDGVGVDVMDATRIVLDKLGFDAEYVHGDIGWEFWRTEANPLPDRTIETAQERGRRALRRHHLQAQGRGRGRARPRAAGQGPRLPLPHRAAAPGLQPATTLRPCKAYPGNPLNYKDGIDLVVFRENTEGLYVGVEFTPVPQELAMTLHETHPKPMGRFADGGQRGRDLRSASSPARAARTSCATPSSTPRSSATRR